MSGESGRRRRLEESASLGAGVALALALFAIVNYFGWKYHGRFDWTASRLYTLSEKTGNVLDGLDRDVEAVVFLTPGGELYEPVVELLSRYAARSPRVSVRLVDPQKNLAEAQSLVDRYELSGLEVVVLDAGDDRRVIDAADLADYDYAGLQFGQGAEMTAFKGEQVFTGALVELIESRKPRILFTTGHGELRLDDMSLQGLSMARDLLGDDNFEIEEWSPLGDAVMPADTDLVVVAGPRSNFLEPEVLVLKSYLDAGGRLLVLLDPTLDERDGLVETGLEGLLASYGVRVGGDIVIDPAQSLPFFGAETILVDSYGDHPITRPLAQGQLPLILQLARSIGPGEAVEGLETTVLMRTSGEGWGETDFERLERVERGEADLAGPVSLAVTVTVSEAPGDGDSGDGGFGDGDSGLQEIESGEPGAGESGAGEPGAGETGSSGAGSAGVEAAEPAAAGPPRGEPPSGASSTRASSTSSSSTGAASSGEMRLLIVGDSDFVTNTHLQSLPNATFFANAMNWLVERETLVGIPPRKPEQLRLSLTRSQLSAVTWLVLAVLPGLALAAGAVVTLRRRR